MHGLIGVSFVYDRFVLTLLTLMHTAAVECKASKTAHAAHQQQRGDSEWCGRLDSHADWCWARRWCGQGGGRHVG